MRSMLNRYRTALVIPGMPRVIAAAFTAYLLSGMMNLSLLLAAQRITGSFAAAGLVAGAYAAALAFAAPFWGRLVDRKGPRGPLLWAVGAQATMVAVFVVAGTSTSDTAVLLIAAGLTGACTPPTSTVARRVMAAVPDEAAQRTLFALSGFITEAVFIIGPLVVAVIVLVVHPLWAIGVAAVASGAGALILRGSTAARRLDLEIVQRPATGSSRTAGWNAAQIRVLGVIALGAVAIGGVQVSVVAHAQVLGTSEGVFVAALAVGGVVASFLYGGMAVPGSLPVQLATFLALYGALILTLALAPVFAISIVLMLLIGAATGPADGIEAMLIGQYTPPAGQSQAFAVLVTANWIGFALGSASAGAVIERVGPAAGVVLAGAAALVAAALALFSRAPRDAAAAA
ncbi:MFS transporter [Lentzea flaviverrucosa]|uniref:Predicted arabinose efflux permease, MFS family n=1 Tax=Lentzea flaviverrucosa TaxID=200379 RepID=A0A1H9F972_9PSEU|nr:MFS transporter [Lentzea flaviverrucosa]RDI35269.1 putative MFS family arabinose efflux permease [Lentzea flaviverrucosa]SEQ34457.1 Predicted arabinose efflux permease, MFS family [Lentzea flaviverrucosa]